MPPRHLSGGFMALVSNCGNVFLAGDIMMAFGKVALLVISVWD